MRTRLEKLRQRMQAEQMDAVLITSGVNRRYLSGFTGTAGVLLITQDRARLVTDFRYIEQAEDQAPAFDIVNHKGKLSSVLNDELQEQNVRRIGFENRELTVAAYERYKDNIKGVEWKAMDGMAAELRLVKEPGEVKVIRDAVRIIDDTFDHILSYIRPGVRENEIALELEFYMRRLGADGPSFDTIVASGERSAQPHGVASEKKLASGELITLDFGAVYKGYCSDMTRTVALGEVSNELRTIYDVVLRAQEEAVEGIRPGRTGKEADAIARDIIEDEGYGRFFGHGMGHGIGMDVHEGPSLSPRSDTTLKPGMVVTVEPGIYLPQKGGVRIEDDVLITETGKDVLTSSNKTFTVL